MTKEDSQVRLTFWDSGDVDKDTSETVIHIESNIKEPIRIICHPA